MSIELDFVKGHCGWDVVTLLPQGLIPASAELDAAIRIVSAPVDGGLEVGFLGRGERADEIQVRMVNSTTRDWIPMCGGMTQVIGKALVETFLRDHFEVDVSNAAVTRTLITPAGEIPLHIDIGDGRAKRILTVMDGYLHHIQELGIESLVLQDIPVLRVGAYAVMDIANLEARYRGVNFTRRDFGPHLDIVNEILRAFRERLGVKGVNGMLYDDRPEGPGQYRVYPRFYSDDLAAARIPWEFQCGTGSIAVAVALAHTGRLGSATRSRELIFEWGSYLTTRDPYGIRTSRLSIEQEGNTLSSVAFSHSVVEIIAQGRLQLPAY